MWVLIFLITLLLGMARPEENVGLGSAFIIASGAVYFLFMTAWLNLLVFLGFILDPDHYRFGSPIGRGL